ncbi:hypothetical protein LLE49_23675 [Alicyclobacillus tolerans]|uniref:hypothetical protein n=1 Tax=Alicyclobacillus tolerans TaxID=90970 RepID=UPI001F3D58B1|nr:hypothetical protein [Alicyclobacillus tolerans]MCF8567724.1 hypothetical protein [Alicyclobacillus tolerans]
MTSTGGNKFLSGMAVSPVDAVVAYFAFSVTKGDDAMGKWKTEDRIQVVALAKATTTREAAVKGGETSRNPKPISNAKRPSLRC